MKDELLASKISDLTKKAKELMFNGNYQTSIEKYQEGLSLLGNRVMGSKYAVMLFSGIGEIYFLDKKWENALEYYGYAVNSEGGLGEPLIHLRLGQLRFELGHLEKAKDELMRAYMGGGDLMFKGEDPKYFQIIREITNR
jgi:tetratricopeptide (TPR) repeat protein